MVVFLKGQTTRKVCDLVNVGCAVTSDFNQSFFLGHLVILEGTGLGNHSHH